MGLLAQKMGDYSAAIVHFAQYLLLNPDDPQRTAIEQNLKMLRKNDR